MKRPQTCRRSNGHCRELISDTGWEERRISFSLRNAPAARNVKFEAGIKSSAFAVRGFEPGSSEFSL